jgi:hypothetical protein
VADIVLTLQVRPWLTIEDKEARLRPMSGAVHSNLAGSSEPGGESVNEALEGQRTLKNLIALLNHWVALHRHLSPERPRAFSLQSLTASIEAARSGKLWELAWPLWGIRDPDARRPSITVPAENVAFVAFANEMERLTEAISRAKAGTRERKACRATKGRGARSSLYSGVRASYAV